jgi:predicted ribosome quality control (RQC) complex YloA/Tae2 family protein
MASRQPLQPASRQCPQPPLESAGRQPPQLPLQQLDVTGLKAVLTEWRANLLPSRFEKAQQPDPQAIQLGLRSLSGIHWLELSWQPDAARLHRIDPPPRQGDGSTLAQQLQHGLRGLALVAIEQPGWERVVKLAFARRPAEPPERWLVAELMGRHSNLFLLDGQRRVIALARQVRSQQSRLRPIGTGDNYINPPPLAGEPPRLEESAASWRRRLSLLPLPLAQALLGAYQGVSPALVAQLLPADWQQLPVQSLSDDQWQLIWRNWRHWLEAVAAERFCWQPQGPGYRCWSAGQATVGPSPQGAHRQGPEPGSEAAARAAAAARGPVWPLNQAIAHYYQLRLDSRRFEQQRQQLRHRLEQAAERERHQASEQQGLLAATRGSQELQSQADELLSQRQPSRACIDSAQALYKRARKLRRAVAAIEERLALHRQRLEAIEASLTYLEQADDLEQLQGLAQDSADLLGSGRRQGQGPGGGSRREQRGVPRPLELQTPDGLTVQVGRNHRQNEWISLRQARRGDLWFHAQELPGSHVVLKSSAQVPSEADLQSAADLAAHFSRGRGNSRVPVVMVATDDLQRIPAAVPGTVSHRGGTVLWGRPQRADALLAAVPSLKPASGP